MLLKVLTPALILFLASTSHSAQCKRLVGNKEPSLEHFGIRSEVEGLLKVSIDKWNAQYFGALYKMYLQPAASQSLILYNPDKPNQVGPNTIYPTPVAPPEMLKAIDIVQYSSLDPAFAKEAENVTLGIQKMQAGTGSGISRKTFLTSLSKVGQTPKIGSKGTDLVIGDLLKAGQVMSLAQAQILQAQIQAAQGDYEKIIWYDIVSSETQSAIKAEWKKIDSNKTAPLVLRGEEILQQQMPTLDSNKKLTANRLAPAGHGLFAFRDLVDIAKMTQAERKQKIWVLSNGEDLSSSPDPLIVGYMRKNKIPLLMVTTDKTSIDIQGGLISMAIGTNAQSQSFLYPTIFELAQAKASGQASDFEKTGLLPGQKPALFNTNMALINLEVLGPFLEAELKTHGEAFLSQILTPNLIANSKEQVDPDGQTRKYTQLEGTISSVMLNLDRYFRSSYGVSLITFLNIESQFRTKFFAPIKTAFDYWMQFYSDRFSFDSRNYRIVDNRPGFLPKIKLLDPDTADKYYTDVTNVLTSFNGTKIRELNDLEISGKVILGDVKLSGSVKIINMSGDPKKLIDIKEWWIRKLIQRGASVPEQIEFKDVILLLDSSP
jgi:hypothetical protein